MKSLQSVFKIGFVIILKYFRIIPAPMCPERHLDAAAMLGNEGMNNKKEDAGLILADMVRNIMDVMKVPDGLSALNYTIDDVPALVAGAIPQVKFFSEYNFGNFGYFL